MKKLLIILLLNINAYVYAQVIIVQHWYWTDKVFFSFDSTDFSPFHAHVDLPKYGSTVPGLLILNGHSQNSNKVYVQRNLFDQDAYFYVGNMELLSPYVQSLPIPERFNYKTWATESSPQVYISGNKSYVYKNFFTISVTGNNTDTLRIANFGIADCPYSYRWGPATCQFVGNFIVTQTGCGSKLLDYFTVSGVSSSLTNEEASFSVNTWTNTGYSFKWSNEANTFSGSNFSTKFLTDGSKEIVCSVYNSCGDFLGNLNKVVSVSGITSSISKFSESTYSNVYPNPFTGYFNINGLKTEKISITDLKGNEQEFIRIDNKIKLLNPFKGILILRYPNGEIKLISE